MSADLVAFLRAQIDEDEQLAQRAESGSFTVQGDGGGAVTEFLFEQLSDGRALAEVTAKRAILAAHPISGTLSSYAQSYGGKPFGCETCHEFDGIICGEGYCATLRALVAPFASRAGFDPSWLD